MVHFNANECVDKNIHVVNVEKSLTAEIYGIHDAKEEVH